MKKLIILLFLACIRLNAQDLIPTENGKVKVTPILHGSLVLEFNELTIFIDPYGGSENFRDFGRADLILITDIHGDHLHKSTLQSLNTANSHFIVPQAVAEQITEMPAAKKIVLGNGERTVFNEVEIEAIPMYNLPEDEESRHTKGRGNGYILAFGGKRIYISGDTEDIPEMRKLENIDVAFICMNLPYTMSVEQAADAVLAFKPYIVYPYHFRGQGGLADVDHFKKLVQKSDKSIEVRLREWYPKN